MPDSIHNPVWDTAIAKVRERSHGSFDAWFAGVQYDGQLGALSSGSPFDGQSANGNSSCSHVGGNTCGNTNSKIQLRARDEFTRDWIKDHFQPAILQEIANAGGFASDIQWTIDPKIENPIGRPRAHAVISQPATSNPPPPSGTQHAAPKPVSAPPAGVNAKYTFANFVVGPSNQLAFAAAAAASGGSGRRYNPLFLCGSTGLGKTHLLHAIALRIHSERPTARIVYGSADSFTNEFIAAISERKMDEFRTRFHQCEAFLVDDVQSLAGRNQTQEEFFNTFNILHACDKQIVLAADKYPKQLDRMEQRLVSRFTWGLVADVQTPEFETRVAIVQKKARLENLDLPDGVAHLLAEAVQSNVRELEGALIRLIAKSSLLGCHLDLDFAKRELSTTHPSPKELATVERIQETVCNHFHVSPDDMLSKARQKSISRARHIAMFLCRQRLKCSFPEIGRAFANRDHSTVMSAVRKVETMRDQDPELRSHIDEIERRLSASGR